MAWDFQTDPEFQKQLDWATQLIREEIWPIEPVAQRGDYSGVPHAAPPVLAPSPPRGVNGEYSFGDDNCYLSLTGVAATLAFVAKGPGVDHGTPGPRPLRQRRASRF